MSPPLFLLVYPRVPDTYWSYTHALRFVRKKALMPPLGLATIAAMIPDRYECRIVDLNVELLDDSLIDSAALVMISAMLVQRDSLEGLIRRCRSRGARIVLGGPYATSCHDEIEGVDHFVLGEAEQLVPRLIDDFERGSLEAVYRATERPDLALSPTPRFDLFRTELYDTVPLQFSRGCPYDCEFCDVVGLFGHRSRTKPPHRVIAELDAAFAAGFRGSAFLVDDNFIGNRRAARELLPAIAAWQKKNGRPFTLITEASIDLADDEELLAMMVDAGFTMVFIGIESPDKESLASAGKLQNLRRDIAGAVRAIQATGIEVSGGFIVGFDSDTEAIFDHQIRFVEELAIPTAMVGLLTALPNTKLYHRLAAEGRLRGTAAGNNTHIDSTNFVPIMNETTLREGYLRVLSTIYSPRRYFRRCLALLRRYPRKAAVGSRMRKIELREIVGLLNSLTRQLTARYAPFYLGYLVRALISRPDLIVSTVTMAIQGHHYFTITRRLATARRRNAMRIRRSEPGAERFGALLPEPTT